MGGIRLIYIHTCVYDYVCDDLQMEIDIHIYLYLYVHTFQSMVSFDSIRSLMWGGCQYGVATASRIHKIIGLFCRISSLL